MQITTERLRLTPLEAQKPRSAWIGAPVVRGETKIDLATIADLDGLAALESEWRALFDDCGQPQQVFQTFEWLALWAPLYVGARTRLSIVTGRIDGRLVLVWPLVVRRMFGLRVLSFMGEPASQYGDALVAADLDQATTEAALDYVMALPVDVVSFRRVRDDAAMAAHLRRRLGPPSDRQAAPFVDVAKTRTAEAFEGRFPGKLRASRRRRRRRLEERGAVTFTSYGPSPEASELITTALAYKREWARRNGVLAPALRDHRFEAFFAAAARPGQGTPALRVSALRCGEDIAGIEISIACKGRLFGHILAPCPDFARLGVGGILAELTIVSALEQGYAAIDLLAPADPYKLELTTDCIGVSDYCLARNKRGALYTRLWLRFGRDAVKTTINRLQPALATLSRRVTWLRSYMH